MEVFISWSGNRSKAVATLLKKWIPDIMQHVTPWVSHLDINAGARWSNEIQERLSRVKFGIICLTGTNMNAPWVLFEAGALAKTLNDSFVCPYLIDVGVGDIPAGPLAQFQAKCANKEDTWDLVKSINSAERESALLEEKLLRAFERWWPELETGLADLPRDNREQKRRTSDDKLDEVLSIVRELHRSPIKRLLVTDSGIPIDFSAIVSLHDMGKANDLLHQRAGRMSRKRKDDNDEPEPA